MTTQRKRHVVADDVLGKVSRKVYDLTRRILEGGADPKRSEFFLQRALEEPPASNYGHSSCSWGTYVLESSWAWDNSHYDFATFALEKCYSPIKCEDLLDPKVPQSQKDRLLQQIEELHTAQTNGPKPRMVRLYRVVGANYFGVDPSTNSHIGGTLKGERVDIHFSLLPICDFNQDGKPVPCNITA